MEVKTLYKQNKDKSTQVWKIWTEGATIKTSFGRLDGAMQESAKEVIQKNVGRSNETTLDQQADLEALSMWKHKKDKGYVEDINSNMQREIAPMLAQVFEKRKDKVKYCVDVQPKLDGCRCLSYWDGDRVVLLSRGNKEFNIPHISEQLKLILPRGIVLDGEIYIHGVPFQTITSWIKKERPETKQLQYWIYDAFQIGEKVSWENRKLYLKDLSQMIPLRDDMAISLKIVQSEVANSEKEVYAIQEKYVSQGFEGAIVRELNAPYEVGHRSNSLLKVKSFDDTEYNAIDFTCGVGKFSKCVIWICKDNNSDKTFAVVPKATLEEKEEWYANGNSFIGQWLKVKHFGLTDDGLPRFPVGLGFRMPEDM